MSLGAGVSQRELSERANDKLRDAAKWLMGVFAAVGGALIAGSQLSNIGHLDFCFDPGEGCSRLWVAILGGSAALFGIARSILIAVNILTYQNEPLSKLVAEWREENSELRQFFTHNLGFLQGFDDLEDVQAQEREVEERQRILDREYATASEARRVELDNLLESVNSEMDDIYARSESVVAIANQVMFAQEFRNSIRKMLRAAGVSALGIGFFAWASNPPPA